MVAGRLGGVDGIGVWDMIAGADPVVKAVMAILALASVWSWAVMVSGWLRIRAAERAADAFENRFWSGIGLDELYAEVKDRLAHPLETVFVAAMREWRRSCERAGERAALAELALEARLSKVMRVAIAREMERISGQIGYLATLGSAAPFIGLFGTVWGIMNSFQDIALASNTSLAVVAPGIAEALLATAMGLVAAIPAVVAYNKLAGDLGRYAGRLEGFADEFSTVLARRAAAG
ncbi:MAG: Tol-Pal system subunit TolQ [Rhodothalassiaceae bacterium]|nr:MAG: Tol-Pal system subunit TolQ [Rhodothalassiaceae bacterium]